MTITVDHALGRSVTVSAGDLPLLTYVYAPETPQLESPKPYLHPLRTLAGDVVSLFRPHDHVWHKGIAWSLPCVGEHNFWGGPTYVHGSSYVQLPNNGTATHRTMTALTATPSSATVAHHLDWTAQQGAPVLAEHRTLTAALADETTWTLVFETHMTNVSGGSLALGSPTTKGRENAGYGGLFWRGPRSFTGGVVQSPEGTGADDLRGKRAEWFAFRGRHDETGRSSTVLMVDDRANPHHPPQWFARSEEFACLNPAPFFSTEFDLPDREVIAFRVAVVIAAGDHGEDGTRQLADLGSAALSNTALSNTALSNTALGGTALNSEAPGGTALAAAGGAAALGGTAAAGGAAGLGGTAAGGVGL